MRRRAQKLFHSIVSLRFRCTLPLHVLRRIGTASLQRNDERGKRAALDVIPLLASSDSRASPSAGPAVHNVGSTLHNTDPKPGSACEALLAYRRTFASTSVAVEAHAVSRSGCLRIGLELESARYHEDMKFVILGLFAEVRSGNSTDPSREVQALINLLIELGPQGWYSAKPYSGHLVRDQGLQWLWKPPSHFGPVDPLTVTLFHGLPLELIGQPPLPTCVWLLLRRPLYPLRRHSKRS
jgi:hypothetical protein